MPITADEIDSIKVEVKSNKAPTRLKAFQRLNEILTSKLKELHTITNNANHPEMSFEVIFQSVHAGKLLFNITGL
jgi:hypothetical protein